MTAAPSELPYSVPGPGELHQRATHASAGLPSDDGTDSYHISMDGLAKGLGPLVYRIGASDGNRSLFSASQR